MQVQVEADRCSGISGRFRHECSPLQLRNLNATVGSPFAGERDSQPCQEGTIIGDYRDPLPALLGGRVLAPRRLQTPHPDHGNLLSSGSTQS